MKKYIIHFALIICAFSASAQNSNSRSILVRHDTVLLKAAECEWIIKSLAKNDPSLTSVIGKSVPLIILEAIEKGKLKATDTQNNKVIPGKEIFKWQMPVDSMQQFDLEGNFTKVIGIQRLRSADHISQIRIYQDWYFDIATAKLHSDIKWIELLEEVYTSTGYFIGYSVLCRIYY